MNAADIPNALRWDISHARRALRGQPPPLLQDALRMECQRSRPRKRLQKWLILQIDIASLEIQNNTLLQKIEESLLELDAIKAARLVKRHGRVFRKLIALKDSD